MSNMQTLTQALKFDASCESLSIAISFDGACFGHALGKLNELTQQIVIRFMLGYFYSCSKGEKKIKSCITWPKKSRKRCQAFMDKDYIHGI